MCIGLFNFIGCLSCGSHPRNKCPALQLLSLGAQRNKALEWMLSIISDCYILFFIWVHCTGSCLTVSIVNAVALDCSAIMELITLTAKKSLYDFIQIFSCTIHVYQIFTHRSLYTRIFNFRHFSDFHIPFVYQNSYIPCI